ncbi:MAG: FxsA family protein [Gammaproteobacteria bacterium]|nr:FxsA family protein [Gammaproteobacteria bacterium]
MPLFIIFVLVPLIELMLLIEVGGIIGTAWTFIIIIATALIGTKLVKQQGLSTWSNIQTEMASGQLPARSLFDGICILISGVLLITPGFITDTIGFLLVTPPFRAAMYSQLGSRIQIRTMGGTFHSQSQSDFSDQAKDTFESDTVERKSGDKPTTLDGEYTRKD